MVKEDLNSNLFKTLFYYEDKSRNRRKIYSPYENKTVKNDSLVFCLSEEKKKKKKVSSTTSE